jgi:hypothetical protein
MSSSATQRTSGEERGWIERRLAAACREFGTQVRGTDGRLVVTPA